MHTISNWFPVVTFLAATLFPVAAFSQQAPIRKAASSQLMAAALNKSDPPREEADVVSAGVSYSTSVLPVADPQASPASRGFFTRLGHVYLDDWTVGSNGLPTPAAPKRRGTPAPLNSPPFPSPDWPVGGTVVIGAADTQTYPLMKALKKQDSRTKVYGWINIGGNASTSNKGKYANGPVAYDVIPNSIQLDQAALYIERLPDTVQTDHFDYGFRFTSLYGLDYRYTTSKGVFSQQLLSYSSGQTYGFDEVMYYFDFYVPKIGKGTDVRVGRYISIPDIEAQLAPNNYTYSHSILYTFDCYTQHGVNVTTKVSEHLKLQAGVSAGCDIAPWAKGAKLTGNVCADYSWKNGGDRLYACANSLNSAKYGYNNLSGYYLTYYHSFSPTWHAATEFLYQYQREVPNNDYAGPGPVTSPSPITGANGAHCNPAAMHCFAPDYGVVNYIEHEFNNHHSSFTIRNEFDNDVKGQRTGNATRYTSHLVGFNFWLGSTVTFRPELRFDHAYDKVAYDAPYLGSPTKKSQFTMAGDLIYHF